MNRRPNFEEARLALATSAGELRKTNWAVLHRRLSERVIERFSLACGAVALIADVSAPALERDEEPPPNPAHPLCLNYADSDYCRESWQLHLAQLTSHPRTHCHKCDFGLHCAVVPVICKGRCSAAVKLACPSDESELRLESLVGVLNALVRDFAATEVDFLEMFSGPGLTAKSRRARLADATESLNTDASHSLVMRAVNHVEKNLSDPKLTVGRVASALGVHADYLSHVFASEAGQRMGHFITDRRIDQAKAFLAATDWQIKRIALETGYANPSWFSLTFRARTGVTPAEYRTRTRRLIA